MKSADLQRFVDSVRTFMLVTGQEITARIVSVDADTIRLSKPRMFVPAPNPRNQNELSVMCLHYGYPLYEADEDLRIETNHIVTVFTPKPDMVTAYTQKTSGIVAASPNVMDQLKGLDFSKLGKQ